MSFRVRHSSRCILCKMTLPPLDKSYDKIVRVLGPPQHRMCDDPVACDYRNGITERHRDGYSALLWTDWT